MKRMHSPVGSSYMDRALHHEPSPFRGTLGGTLMSEQRAQLAPDASPYAGHIPALDGIRGWAVLAVMSSHLFPGTARSPVARAIQALFVCGATGVDLFFVLSGFLITGILFDSLQDQHFFRKFYARRILRIFPLYYAVLACYAVTVLFGRHYSNQLWSMALYVQNTHLIARAIYDYAGPSPLPLAHFWSLAIEEQFYLLWPFVIFLLPRRRPLLLLCLVATLLCPLGRAYLWMHGWPYFPVHDNTLLRADSLLAGAALALLLRSRLRDDVFRLAAPLFLGGIVGTAATMLSSGLDPAVHSQWVPLAGALSYTGFNLICTALIVFALQPGWWSALCRTAPLRSLGKYSYGLYVLHLPLFTYLQQPVRNLLAEHLTRNKGVGVAVTGLTCFALSVVAAFLSYQLYEKQFLRLKRLFSYGEAVPART